MASMTKTYLVTGVGCRRREETLVVPEGVQIVFYRMRSSPVRTPGVRTPRDELMIAARLLPARAAGPGECVQAAFCWQRGVEVPPSGVHRHSTGARVMDLFDTSPRRPVALDYIVRELTANRQGRTTVIHWLVEPGEPAPVRQHWRLQRPPRLHNGDAAESGHAPLAELAGPAGRRDEPEERVPPGWVTVSLRP
jgi:hypothetical protein